MSRSSLSEKIYSILPGEQNKRIREAIMEAASYSGQRSNQVRKTIEEPNRLKTGLLTAGTVEFTSTTSTDLDLFSWVINYQIFQPGPLTLPVTAPHASVARPDYFIGKDDGSIVYRAGIVDSLGNVSFPTVAADEVLLRSVLRKADGTNVETPTEPDQGLPDHNATKNIQGGKPAIGENPAEYYHLLKQELLALQELIADYSQGARKVSAEYLISSDTAGTLVIGKWYNAANVLHEVTDQAIVFAGAPGTGELRWDVMVGKEDGTAELITGTAGASATRPDLPAGSVVLFEVIWNEEGGTSGPPDSEESVWSLDRFNTATIADTTGKYCKIMEMNLGFAMDYAFTIDYGAPATLAANKVGSLHVAFVTTEANIIHGPTVKMTTVGFSDPGDFVLVQLPANKAALYHHSTNYWMRLQWRVVFQNWAMSLENFKNGEEYGTLPAGTNWSSEVYADLSEITSDLTDLEDQVQDIETEVADHEDRITDLEGAATGDLIAGTGVSFTGSGTGRLVGSGNLTINATGGGGGGSGLSDLVGFPVIPFNGNFRHSHEMFEPVEISVNTSLARTFPNYSVIYIKADGTNKPTFKDSDNFSVVYDGWNNTAGVWNRLRIEWSPQGIPVVQIMATSGASSPGTGATDFALLFDADYSFSHVIAGTVSLSVDDTGAAYAKKTIFYFMADGSNKPTWSSDIECNFDNYVNAAGVWNRFYLEYTPEDKVTLQIQNT